MICMMGRPCANCLCQHLKLQQAYLAGSMKREKTEIYACAVFITV